MLSKITQVSFDPSANPERWTRFVEEIMGDNQGLMSYLQQLFGITLTGITTEHVLPICYGVGGNGKSVFLNTIGRVLGPDYSMKSAADLLTVRNGEAHPTAIADLCNTNL